MKKLPILSVLFCAITLINISCTKDEITTANEAKLRITKIADNQAMENPWYTFEYDAQNLLVKISSEDQYSAIISEITYNVNKRPVKVTTTSYYSGYVEGITVTNIQWTNNGFVISDEDDFFNEQDTYEIDTKGRVLKKINIFTPQGSDPETTVITANWIGDESLNIPEYSSHYKFVKKNNPFSGINLAAVIATELEYGEWEGEFQNNFCISEWNEEGLSAVITYQFNDQNYPFVADIKYTSEEGTMHDYVYFEYESY